MKTPGEQLIEKLNYLRTRLEDSGVERTIGLRDQLGNNCEYYKKSLDLFLRKDYIDLKNLHKQIDQLFKVVEGNE